MNIPLGTVMGFQFYTWQQLKAKGDFRGRAGILNLFVEMSTRGTVFFLDIQRNAAQCSATIYCMYIL